MAFFTKLLHAEGLQFKSSIFGWKVCACLKKDVFQKVSKIPLYLCRFALISKQTLIRCLEDFSPQDIFILYRKWNITATCTKCQL